jgi:hypothetical protein
MPQAAKPTLVYHADWGSRDEKRWCARATLGMDGHYTAISLTALLYVAATTAPGAFNLAFAVTFWAVLATYYQHDFRTCTIAPWTGHCALAITPWTFGHLVRPPLASGKRVVCTVIHYQESLLGLCDWPQAYAHQLLKPVAGFPRTR